MEPDNTRHRFVVFLATGFAVAVIVLHGISIAAPTGANWGFHFLGFFPSLAGVICVGLMALFLIPTVQERLLSGVELAGNRWRFLPASMRRAGFLGGIALAVFFFWLLRERTLLLGDGALVVRSLAGADSVAEISVVFRTAPLPGLVAWALMKLLALLGAVHPAELAWRGLSIFAGGGGLVVSGRIAAELATEKAARAILFFSIITAGTTQLFFGYVETYPLAYFLALSFIASSLSWYRTGRGLTLVILFFALMVLSHITLAFFLPGFLFLLWKGREKGRRRWVPGLIIAGAFATLVLWITGFTPQQLQSLGELPGTTRLPLFTAVTGAPYPMISLWHITDLLNLAMLVAPFVVPSLFLLGRSTIPIRRDVVLQYLLLLAGGGGIWLFVTHFTIGLSRDWDVAALGTVGWILLGGTLWTRWGEKQRMALRLFAGVTIIAGIHTVAWIATNADQGRSVRRFETLYSERLWSAHAGTYAFEDLSLLSRSRQDHFSSMLYSAKALALDSTNPRRWLHFAGSAQMAGWVDRAIQAYERGLAGPQAEPGHFRDCARLYAGNNRTADAERVLETAHARFPRDAATVVALAELVASKRNDPRRALALFREAAELDPGLPGIAERIQELERFAGTLPP